MKHVHFLRICGTAMGAIASAMARRGYVVTGIEMKPEHADYMLFGAPFL